MAKSREVMRGDVMGLEVVAIVPPLLKKCGTNARPPM
eukprot:CAMPEP_0168417550 /NCGR_PEP_ID=MMETSP0228-20121227/31313_1 /TAXON_ID=133427 /ORGANISM="Protoceratium reticulatum, Strain CCCM 535 (=CCMP 1889)" /LENGTH=36 /DNA_ID= /DNA_START= /DNA_END= /DNA_ORIENTATION=